MIKVAKITIILNSEKIVKISEKQFSTYVTLKILVVISINYLEYLFL